MHPAKAIGRKEMQFGKDSCAVPSNIVLDRGPPTGKGDLGVEIPVVIGIANCGQTVTDSGMVTIDSL